MSRACVLAHHPAGGGEADRGETRTGVREASYRHLEPAPLPAPVNGVPPCPRPSSRRAPAGSRAGLRRALLVLALSSLALPAGLRPAPTAAPPSFADLVTRVAPAVVNVATRKDVGPRAGGDERGQQRPDIPQFPPGSPFEEFFKGFSTATTDRVRSDSSAAPSRSARASSSTRRLHRHQQPRRRGRRRDHRRSCNDGTRARGQAGRHATPRPTWRCSRSRRDNPLPVVEFGDSDTAARRRLGGRGRQPVRPRRHGDAPASSRRAGREIDVGPLRRLPPDRRRRSTAATRAARRFNMQGRGDRHQHRHLLAVRRQRRHRLRHRRRTWRSRSSTS